MAVKASMGDMHLMLMEQMERLCTVDKDGLGDEIARTEAMAELGKAVVQNASLMIKAARMTDNMGSAKLLTGGN